MNAPPRERLYSPELLGLATNLAQWPFDKSAPLIGEARSRTCGSAIIIGITPDVDGRIERFGMRVSACAVGQAAAAIFAGATVGRNGEEIGRSLAAVESWLAGRGQQPVWPGIDAIAPAVDFPQRHGAILLPWKAACAALCKAEPAS